MSHIQPVAVACATLRVMAATGTSASRTTAADLTILHTSDLHLGTSHGDGNLRSLTAVANAVRQARAQLLLLVGDTFDHNRVPASLIAAVVETLATLDAPVVILPGNHDCLTDGSVWRRADLRAAPKVTVLGLTGADSLLLDEFNLEIWGKAHHDHVDMQPLAGAPSRRRRRHLALAHGHWVTGSHDYHRSWLIRDEEIQALDSDYLALGHWDRAVTVSQTPVPAYYSGSPESARTANLVRFSPIGVVLVERFPLPGYDGLE